MTVYHHLAHALRIMRIEPDYTKWGPLLDMLTPEAQAECRPWLREEVRMKRLPRQPRASRESPPASSRSNLSRPATTSRPRKGAPR
jgi:hypothetical protein